MSTQQKFGSVFPNNNLKRTLVDVATPQPMVYWSQPRQPGQQSNSNMALIDVHKAQDVSLSFNATTPGSTGVVTIPPTYPHLYQVYLMVDVVLKPPAIANREVIAIVPFAANAVIDSYTLRVNGAERINVDGRQMLFHTLANCESRQAKDELQEFSGRRTKYHADRVTLMCPIWIPGREFNGTGMPFPNFMTQTGLEFAIKWRDEAAYSDGLWSFSNHRIRFTYGELADIALRRAEVYKYPFGYRFTQELAVSANGDVTLNLGNLRDGENSQIMIAMFQNTNRPCDLFKTSPLKNIQILYAGQTIVDYEQHYGDLESIQMGYNGIQTQYTEDTPLAVSSFDKVAFDATADNLLQLNGQLLVLVEELNREWQRFGFPGSVFDFATVFTATNAITAHDQLSLRIEVEVRNRLRMDSRLFGFSGAGEVDSWFQEESLPTHAAHPNNATLLADLTQTGLVESILKHEAAGWIAAFTNLLKPHENRFYVLPISAVFDAVRAHTDTIYIVGADLNSSDVTLKFFWDQQAPNPAARVMVTNYIEAFLQFTGVSAALIT